MVDLATAALLVAIVGLAVAGLALVPMVIQGWYDFVSSWPYSIENVGRLRSVVFGRVFMFRVFNHTTSTAYFAVRIGQDVLNEGNESLVPHYLSTSPIEAKNRLLVDIPPRVWVDVRVSPFGPQYPKPPDKFTIGFIENSHWKSGRRSFTFPEDLDKDSGINETDLTYGRAARIVNF